MKTYKFDCNGHNAPAYGCSEPGDNSGEYIKKADILALLRADVADINKLDPGEKNNSLFDVKQTLVYFISEIEEASEKSSSKQPEAKE